MTASLTAVAVLTLTALIVSILALTKGRVDHYNEQADSEYTLAGTNPYGTPATILPYDVSFQQLTNA